MKEISATKARNKFGELIRNVTEKGETVVVKRGEKPCVVIISIDEYRKLKSAYNQESWEHTLEKLRSTVAKIRARRGDEPFKAPEEIIREVREERNASFTDLY